MRIIKIEGFRGLFHVAFVGICMFAGFVLFPGQIFMNIWNKYLVTLFMFPQINHFQGVLLWLIVFLSYGIIFKNQAAVQFKRTKDLTPSDIDFIMQKAKFSSQIQHLTDIVQSHDMFEKNNNFKSQNNNKNEDFSRKE